MKNKITKRTILRHIPLFIAIILTICACIISFFDNSFIVDSYCFDIHNYNLKQNDSNPAILRVSREDQDKPELYSDIYANYKYNRTINGLRMMIDNDIKVEYDSFDINPSFFFQNTSSISNQLDKFNSYSVDDGLFSSYFSPDILGPNYRSNRGSKCFAYISDSLAYKLIKKSNVELDDYSTQTDAFLDLINGDEHIINLEFGETSLTCSINSVLYSNKRSASRVFNLYGDFVLIFNFQFFNSFHTSVEFDLKQGMFANRSLVTTLKALGITADEYSYLIKSFDKQNDNYITDSRLTYEISSIMESSSNNSVTIFYWILIFLMIPCYLIFGFLVNRKEKIIISGVVLSLFLLFNIVTNFLYVYYVFTPPLIIFVILSVISIFERRSLKKHYAQSFTRSEISI